MALAYDFSIGKGDTLPALVSDLTNDVGDPISLSGATVTLVYVLNPGTSSEVVSQRAATIIDAAKGRVQYQWLAGDTQVVGVYEFYWKVITPAGNQMTCPNSYCLRMQIVNPGHCP
ncbi:MAG: phage baseplate upper protein [Chloroflexi bacterium]|nr:phage baseplate upper protein [Chloroflexota bacterium]